MCIAFTEKAVYADPLAGFQVDPAYSQGPEPRNGNYVYQSFSVGKSVGGADVVVIGKNLRSGAYSY